MASRGNAFGPKGSQGDVSSPGASTGSPSVSEALAVLRRAASSPQAHAALKTLENEVGGSDKKSSSKAPRGGNSPFEQRAARQAKGSSTAQKGAA